MTVDIVNPYIQRAESRCCVSRRTRKFPRPVLTLYISICCTCRKDLDASFSLTVCLRAGDRKAVFPKRYPTLTNYLV